MNNQKSDAYYIGKAIDNIESIIKYCKNKTFEEFVGDELLLDATMFRLIQMAENLNHVSSEKRIEHPEIKWGLIIGFRNGIVHEYGKTDYTIVYQIISKDIDELKTNLSAIIE